MYVKKAEYTTTDLTRFYLQDLIVDIRCARRDGLHKYASKCEGEFRALWPTRHNATIDRYGIPTI